MTRSPLGANLIKELREPQDRTFVRIGIDASARMPERQLGIAMMATTAQQRDGMFAMIAGGFNELIQDLAALLLGGFAIAGAELGQILFRWFAGGQGRFSRFGRECLGAQILSIFGNILS